MLQFYKSLPFAVKWPIARLAMMILYPFTFNVKVWNKYIRIKHSLGFNRVLKPGDTAVQAGVDWTTPPSYTIPIGNWVGATGTVVAIEPMPSNIERTRAEYIKRAVPASLILVQKAAYSKSEMMRFKVGKKGYWNRLDLEEAGELKDWEKEHFADEHIDVHADSIDNILKENDIPFDAIRFVSLTINGAERDALIGMSELLSQSKDISINVVAGRTNSNLSTYGDRKDTEVISELLQKHGFKTRFHLLGGKRMGYVMGVKGNARFFLS
jgi:FkbM family methyltransferase